MQITCTRSLEFDAGHRVMNHEAKCATLHGHRYIAEITAESNLDEIGRVIDFSVLKDLVGGWIDEHWDHNTIVFCQDEKTILGLLQMPRKKEPWIAPWNPTAENIASHLLTVVCPERLARTGVRVTKVIVHETPNCFATAEL